MANRRTLLILLVSLIAAVAGFVLALSFHGSRADPVVAIVAQVASFAGFAVLMFAIYRSRRSNGEA